MTFPRPTLTQLRQQAQSDVQSELTGADALLRYSNLMILATVVAGLTNGHYGYLDYIARQAVPFTATGEALEGWAALKGVLRKPPTPSAGVAAFAVTTAATIPAGTAVIRGDGLAFTTSADSTAGQGVVSAPIAAAASGSTANSDAGTAFSLGSLIAGVSVIGAATGPVTGGNDVETDDSLRSRMLLAFANPPQGGSASDYQQWALAVPGITRCWVAPLQMGPGTIVLYFMMDAAEAAHGGFPQGTNGVATGESRDTTATGDQLTLANALFYGKQPPTPIVYAVAPQANTLTFTIAGLPGASAALQAAIAAAIDGALFLNGKPGGTTNVSTIESAIAAVNGSAGFVITNIQASAGSVNLGAAGNIVSNAGRLPMRGILTFQ